MLVDVILQIKMDFVDRNVFRNYHEIILWHVSIKAQQFIAMHIQFGKLFLSIVSSIMK